MDDGFYEFVDRYFEGKKRVIFQTKRIDFYKYGSKVGKFELSNILLEDLLSGFTNTEIVFFFMLVSKLKPSKNYYESSVVRIRYSDFAPRIGETSCRSARDKLISANILVRTPRPKYFIVNPLYVDKGFKNSEEGGTDKDKG